MKQYIDGIEFTPAQLDAWKAKRIQRVMKRLHLVYDKEKNIEELQKQLTEYKVKQSDEAIRYSLRRSLYVSRCMMKLCAILSGKKRRQAITIVQCDEIDAATFSKKIDELMLSNKEDDRYVNLNACPDHYLLKAHSSILEVIETTGNSPLPTQFFISFEDEDGLQEPRNLSYPFQSCGVARLQDGTIIGGVRHQFKDCDQGLQARLLVEFPRLCPMFIIKEHQKHLALEWSKWISWAIQQHSK